MECKKGTRVYQVAFARFSKHASKPSHLTNQPTIFPRANQSLCLSANEYLSTNYSEQASEWMYYSVCIAISHPTFWKGPKLNNFQIHKSCPFLQPPSWNHRCAIVRGSSYGKEPKWIVDMSMNEMRDLLAWIFGNLHKLISRTGISFSLMPTIQPL